MEFILAIIILALLYRVYRKRFYYLLYQNFTDGISIISDKKIIDCNDTLVRLFGFNTKEELLSAHPLELSPAFQPDDSLSCDKAQAMLEEAKNNGKCKFDWVFVDKQKNEKWIEIDIVKLKKEFLIEQKYCMVWRDIDTRIKIQNDLKEFNRNLETIVQNEIKKNKEQEKQLQVQSKLAQLGEMISMIAHQWRQPLTAISSSVIDLQMKLILNKNDEKLLEYVENHLKDVALYTENLTHTIDDFKDFYQPSKDKKKTNINLVINKTYGIIKTYFSTLDIEFEFFYDSVKEYSVYENELLQIFLNMFQNSRENFATIDKEEKKITVKTEDMSDGVLISICDNGGGCPNEIIGKIFDPYFSTKSKKNGTGLGLYMSVKIIQEHHNGYIKAHNTDDGICFSIFIKD